VVALEGAIPECPRVGIRYSRCPSPTSTWGAATSRHAAVAIILIPSACRRLIVPATSRTPLYRDRHRRLSPSLPAAKEKRKTERENAPLCVKPATTTTTPTLHATTAHHINYHHHQLPRATLASDTSQGKQESKVSTEHFFFNESYRHVTSRLQK